MNMKQVEERLEWKRKEARRKAEDAHLVLDATEDLAFEITGMLEKAELNMKEAWGELEKEMEDMIASARNAQELAKQKPDPDEGDCGLKFLQGKCAALQILGHTVDRLKAKVLP